MSFRSWISPNETPSGLPLFNKDEMFKKLIGDPRYHKLLSFSPQSVALDGGAGFIFLLMMGTLGSAMSFWKKMAHG